MVLCYNNLTSNTKLYFHSNQRANANLFPKLPYSGEHLIRRTRDTSDTMTETCYMVLAGLHFIKLEKGGTAEEGMRGRDKVSQQTSSREAVREMGEDRVGSGSKPLVIHISLSFHPIWAKCKLACFCLRHAGRWGCVLDSGERGEGRAPLQIDTCQENTEKMFGGKMPIPQPNIDLFLEKQKIETDLEMGNIKFFCCAYL